MQSAIRTVWLSSIYAKLSCLNFMKFDEDTILDPPNFRKVLIEEYNST